MANLLTTIAVGLPQPLATDATVATTSTARCHLCRRTVLHGERYALLVPNGQTAHVHCIGRFATMRVGVPSIR